MEQQTAPSLAGRPRDESVGERALAAARDVFAERGWFGTSYDEVAKRAGVGKSSLYLRWPTKTDLVAAALAPSGSTAAINTGALRTDLLQLADALLNVHRSGQGTTTLRFVAEAPHVPELREAAAKAGNGDSMQAVRRIVRRAVARGELPASTSATMIHDLLAGALMSHAAASPAAPKTGGARAKASAYVAALVDAIICAAKA